MDGFRRRFGLSMAGKSPWGPGSGSVNGSGSNGGGADGGDNSPDGEGGGSDGGPRNPWLPPKGSSGSSEEPRRSAKIEDIFRNRGPEGPRRGGGPGSGGPGFRLPERPGGKSWFPLAIGVILLVWLAISSIHQLSPREKGVVTWMGGKYSTTLDPGLHFTLPFPLQQVEVENVSQIRSESIPEGAQEKLILTGDQNLVDLSYLIRWNIKDLVQYKFQLADPEDTLTEVAEFAMRASVAEQELDSVLSGAGRAEIEQRVRSRMQGILDAYGSGIAVQGIEIEKTDPPERVIEAFKDVSAAQQDAETDVNRARAYAQQVAARSQGDAASFDKIYEEYRLAPEVTRRRLYYETMESVLSQTDKTVVETDGVTPYLPLPEVRRRSEAARTGTEGAQ